MANSASGKTCQARHCPFTGPQPLSEFIGGPGDRICRTCRAASAPPAPIPLGDGRTAIVLGGKHAHGRYTYVSDAKVPLVAGLRWRVMEHTNPAGVKSGPYAVSKRPTGHRGAEMVYMHNLVSGFKRTDHQDGDGLNNTDDNLRDLSQSQNCANQGKQRTPATSRFKGVDLHKTGKWRARIKINRREYGLGMFSTEDEGGRAQDLAALGAHGRGGEARRVAALN